MDPGRRNLLYVGGGLMIGGILGIPVGFIAGVAISQDEDSGSINGVLRAGSAAPDFTLNDFKGIEHTLSQYRRMPVVINFWESWCLPCRSEMPTINQFVEAYQGRVKVLAITEDQSQNSSSYLKERGLDSITCLLDTDGKVMKKYIKTDIPTTYIIDSDGTIVAIQIGSGDFMNPNMIVRKTIDNILTQSEKHNTKPQKPDLSRIKVA